MEVDGDAFLESLYGGTYFGSATVVGIEGGPSYDTAIAQVDLWSASDHPDNRVRNVPVAAIHEQYGVDMGAFALGAELGVRLVEVEDEVGCFSHTEIVGFHSLVRATDEEVDAGLGYFTDTSLDGTIVGKGDII